MLRDYGSGFGQKQTLVLEAMQIEVKATKENITVVGSTSGGDSVVRPRNAAVAL